ncbi:SRPBCC domain-containing protein [Streptomyces triticagri]|uniref:SRPBCC domain-containing protein n=1 Tax=Streptomyces triticagri TaxID=2293568 RepID=A0A372MA61_9ACTN|nr:SRPBCC domain-containing protein [Streptomyces triticagri]RFU87806.1 SRPBCC domain-containing protein [Streptomyces triticagri]
MTPTGLTQDAGWQIGVSRTLPYPPAVVWDFIASADGIALWLGEGAELPAAPRKGTPFVNAAGESGEIRSYRPGDRIRATLGSTTVQVTVSEARSSDGTRAVLGFHQEHLPSAHERERRRDHWQSAMDRAAQALESPSA